VGIACQDSENPFPVPPASDAYVGSTARDMLAVVYATHSLVQSSAPQSARHLDGFAQLQAGRFEYFLT